MKSYFTRLIERAMPTGVPFEMHVVTPRHDTVSEPADPFETIVAATAYEGESRPVSMEPGVTVSRPDETPPAALKKTALQPQQPAITLPPRAEERVLPPQVVTLHPPASQPLPVAPELLKDQTAVQRPLVPLAKPSAGIEPPVPSHAATAPSPAAGLEPLARADTFMQTAMRSIVVERAATAAAIPRVEAGSERAETAEARPQPQQTYVPPPRSLQPAVSSGLRPAEPFTPQEAPQLVIGRLSVEVLPQQREPAPAAPRVVIVRPAGSGSFPRPASQRFGLGQV